MGREEQEAGTPPCASSNQKQAPLSTVHVAILSQHQPTLLNHVLLEVCFRGVSDVAAQFTSPDWRRPESRARDGRPGWPPPCGGAEVAGAQEENTVQTQQRHFRVASCKGGYI